MSLVVCKKEYTKVLRHNYAKPHIHDKRSPIHAYCAPHWQILYRLGFTTLMNLRHSYLVAICMYSNITCSQVAFYFVLLSRNLTGF